MKTKLRWAWVVLPSSVIFACSGTRGGSGFGDPDGGSDGGSGGGGDGGGAQMDGSVIIGTNDGGMVSMGPAEVYGESPDTLYKLDPNTKAVTVVGKFQGCSGSVIDIALDEQSNMFGTTSGSFPGAGGLYAIDRKTARCTHIADGNYPNSLSFVPKGTLDPAAEALVGYVDDQYIRIDPMSGAITNVGKLGGGFISSGDIVSVKGGGTYLTVKNNGCSDCIVEVSPSTGAMTKNYGTVMHSQVFGLAFWGGSAFGFDNAGELFEITFNGTSVSTAAITIPNMPAGLQFYGAGSTTSAPLVPVK